MIKIDYPSTLKRMTGYGLFGLLSLLVYGLCLYVKSWWEEPLGWDGLALWLALMFPMGKLFPVIQRVMSEPGTTRSE